MAYTGLDDLRKKPAVGVQSSTITALSPFAGIRCAFVTGIAIAKSGQGRYKQKEARGHSGHMSQGAKHGPWGQSGERAWYRCCKLRTSSSGLRGLDLRAQALRISTSSLSSVEGLPRSCLPSPRLS